MDTLRHWLLPGSFLLCLSLFAGPAKATGFIDLNRDWTGTACADSSSTNCFENATDSSVVIWGPEGSVDSTTYSYGSAGQLYRFSFSYSYSLTINDNLGLQRPFLEIGGVRILLAENTNGAIVSAGTYDVAADQTLVFGVQNSGAAATSEFTVSNFNAQGVPAPLPLFGAAAAFGAIRRRRAALRKAAAGQAVASRD